jgi:hypothetical protein
MPKQWTNMFILNLGIKFNNVFDNLRDFERVPPNAKDMVKIC